LRLLLTYIAYKFRAKEETKKKPGMKPAELSFSLDFWRKIKIEKE
jgi:hypothetical protein